MAHGSFGLALCFLMIPVGGAIDVRTLTGLTFKLKVTSGANVTVGELKKLLPFPPAVRDFCILFRAVCVDTLSCPRRDLY